MFLDPRVAIRTEGRPSRTWPTRPQIINNYLRTTSTPAANTCTSAPPTSMDEALAHDPVPISDPNPQAAV
jgi:hypothetical protein